MEMAGRLACVTGQVHVDGTGLIVVNHRGNGALAHRQIGLVRKRGRTPGDKYHLAGHIHTGIVSSLANGGQQHKVIGRAAAIFRGIQGVQRLIAKASRLSIAEAPALHRKGPAHHAVIVHRGHRQGVGIGPRGTAGIEIGIVQIRIAKGLAGLCPIAVVAHGDGHNRIGLGQGIQ